MSGLAALHLLLLLMVVRRPVRLLLLLLMVVHTYTSPFVVVADGGT